MGKITFFTILCIMITTPTSLGGVTGQLWFEPIDGIYNDEHIGDWGDESWIITNNDFDLTITNHNQKECISIIYLLIAVNANPSTNPIGLTINGVDVDDWTPADGKKPEVPTAVPFLYPTHGIYQTGTWYSITQIVLDAPLCSDESTAVNIVTSGGNGVIKFHGDGVGADENNNAIVFVPPSHDFNNEIPEFPTIALPIAAILGIMFIFSSKNRKDD